MVQQSLVHVFASTQSTVVMESQHDASIVGGEMMSEPTLAHVAPTRPRRRLTKTTAAGRCIVCVVLSVPCPFLLHSARTVSLTPHRAPTRPATPTGARRQLYTLCEQ